MNVDVVEAVGIHESSLELEIDSAHIRGMLVQESVDQFKVGF